MLRFHQFTGGAAWASEYGSADEPAAFAYISPLLAASEHQAGDLLSGHPRDHRRPRRPRGAEPLLQVRGRAAGGPGLPQARCSSGSRPRAATATTPPTSRSPSRPTSCPSSPRRSTSACPRRGRRARRSDPPPRPGGTPRQALAGLRLRPPSVASRRPDAPVLWAGGGPRRSLASRAVVPVSRPWANMPSVTQTTGDPCGSWAGMGHGVDPGVAACGSGGLISSTPTPKSLLDADQARTDPIVHVSSAGVAPQTSHLDAPGDRHVHQRRRGRPQVRGSSGARRSEIAPRWRSSSRPWSRERAAP